LSDPNICIPRGITQAMSELLGDKNLEARLDEIRDIITRMDTRWDHEYFADEQEYIEQSVKLQLKLEQLTPVPMDDLERAADLLENFKTHWKRLEENPEAQHDLVKLIVERVYVKDKEVVAMTLCSNYHLVLGHNVNEPTYYQVDPLYTCGSDGLGVLSGCSCIIWPSNLNHPALIRYLLQNSQLAHLHDSSFTSSAKKV
jgi:hypothetical protein